MSHKMLVLYDYYFKLLFKLFKIYVIYYKSAVLTNCCNEEIYTGNQIFEIINIYKEVFNKSIMLTKAVFI